jgi:hypothetical protein
MAKKKVTTKRVKKTVDERVREILDVIDNALRPSDKTVYGYDQEVARKLWNILSALRGPDNASVFIKDATTGVIRRQAFPKTFKGNFGDSYLHRNLALSYTDDPGKVVFRRDFMKQDHFGGHVIKAFNSLGLNFDAVNPDKQV